MYVPASFAASRATALDLIDAHPFATVITTPPSGPFASHLPLQLDRDRNCLVGHLARANPQSGQLTQSPVLAVFHGPHAYVSPSWYAPRPDAVPTWNYLAVHVRGTVRVLDAGADTVAVVQRLTAQYEPAGHTIDAASLAALGRAIVAFEIALDDVTAKLKLSQNRSADDHASVSQHLAASDDADARRVAAWMDRIGTGRG